MIRTILKWILSGLISRFEAIGKECIITHLPELKKLPFFYDVYFSGGACHCPDWKAPGNVFFSDAPIAIVVTRGGKVSGLFAFEIVGRALIVRQMQGAPHGNYGDGTKPESYILTCIEEIARTLKMKSLRIITAETAIEFRESAPEPNKPSPEVKTRIKKFYDHPKTVGYSQSFCLRLRRSTHYRSLT